MRIFFYSIIAFLFTILAAGMSLAQMMEHSCHEGIEARGAMNMAKCSCSEATRACTENTGNDTLVGADCCPPDACRELFIPKDVVAGSTLSVIIFSGMVQKPSFFQPMPSALSAAYRTTLPPLLLPSTPTYIQNCSFLI